MRKIAMNFEFVIVQHGDSFVSMVVAKELKLEPRLLLKEWNLNDGIIIEMW